MAWSSTGVVGRRENVSRGNRGAWAEALAIVWLIELGYSVFTNVSAHGPVDMIAMRDDETVLIDVKTLNVVDSSTGKRSIGRPKLSTEQVEMGVRLLLVHPEGDILWGD